MDSFDAFWCLFGAIIIDLYAGSWFRAGQSLWHPKNIVGRWVEKLCEKLDRRGRSSSVLLVRGALSVLCTISLAGLAGTAIHVVLVEIPVGWVLELLILTSLVSVGRLWGIVGNCWKKGGQLWENMWGILAPVFEKHVGKLRECESCV